MSAMIDNIKVIFPFFAAAWLAFGFFTWRKPQRLLNCFLLLFALMITFFMAACIFGDNMDSVLLILFLIILGIIFLVPVMLTVNGLVVIKKEGKSFAHMLSLILGILIGAGEIATFAWILNLDTLHIPYGMRALFEVTSLTVIYFSFVILSFVLYSVFMLLVPHGRRYDYIIIHGCGLLHGRGVTKLLGGRIEKAISIYNRCKTKPMLIASGGQGDDEEVSEAFAISEYLKSKGIPEEHIILEDRSATTMENLMFSKELILARDGKLGKIALVTSNYHVYRCLTYAKQLGIRCTGFGSKTALYYWPTALLREFAAVFKTKRCFIPVAGFWLLCMYAMIHSMFF